MIKTKIDLSFGLTKSNLNYNIGFNKKGNQMQ